MAFSEKLNFTGNRNDFNVRKYLAHQYFKQKLICTFLLIFLLVLIFMFIFFQVSIWSINSSQEIGSNENREKNTSHLKRVSLQMQSLHNIKWLLTTTKVLCVVRKQENERRSVLCMFGQDQDQHYCRKKHLLCAFLI